MGENWMIINLDKEEIGDRLGKLAEFLYDGSLEMIIKMLKLPPPLEHSLASVKYGTNRSLTGRLGYLQFPTEILDMIFSELEGPQDVASLCITNSRLLQVGIKHADKLIKSRLWIGDRIICVGSHISNDDLPEGLLTPEEVQELEEYADDPDDPDPCYNLSSVASNYFRSNSFNGTDMYLSLALEKYWDVRGPERKLFWGLIAPYHKDTGPNVLCNLSKQEYVRGEAIAELTGPQTNEFRFGLGTVLLTQICWSSSDSASTIPYCDLDRGPWAGDRFEIGTMDKMRPLIEGQEWKDVTNSVVKEVHNIWEHR